MVGRKRQNHTHLPKRVYRHHGGYRYVYPDGSKTYLGKTEAELYANLSKILENKLVTMGDVLDRYLVEVVPKKSSAKLG